MFGLMLLHKLLLWGGKQTLPASWASEGGSAVQTYCRHGSNPYDGHFAAVVAGVANRGHNPAEPDGSPVHGMHAGFAGMVLQFTLGNASLTGDGSRFLTVRCLHDASIAQHGICGDAPDAFSQPLVFNLPPPATAEERAAPWRMYVQPGDEVLLGHMLDIAFPAPEAPAAA